MSAAISWVLELAIKADDFHEVSSLMSEMVSATQNEPGALIYEWTINDDENHCHIYERYADSEAAMTHIRNFGEHFASRFMTTFEPTRWVVYGEPTEDVREALARNGALFMSPIGGFDR